MKIALITPGILPVGIKTWGGVETCLYNYHLYFNSMGYICDIVYMDDPKLLNKEYDIVHVFMQNQAQFLHDHGIKYFFSPCDHHVMIYGKESDLFKNHITAIENSVLTTVPAEFMVGYFNNLPNIVYLPLGVDTNIYTFKERDIKNREVRLLCLANNGVIGNPTEDRKGFLFAINAAKKLNLPITIAGPTNSNKTFLEYHKPDYNKINVIYDLNEEEVIKAFHDHDIFLHPSSIETGHPNLTLTEAIGTGLPIVGTFWGGKNLKCFYKTERNVDQIVEGIKEVIKNYSSYNLHAKNEREFYKWDRVGYELLCYYLNYVGNHYKISKFETNSQDIFRQKIEYLYNSDYMLKKDPNKNKPIVNINFCDGAFAELRNLPGNHEYTVVFTDLDTNVLIYKTKIKNNHFAKTLFKYFINYNVQLIQDDKVIYEHRFDAKDKRVLISFESSSLGDTIAWFPYVLEFQKKHDCYVIVSTFHNELFKELYTSERIQFVEPSTGVENLYAYYRLGIYNVKDKFVHKKDPRLIPLQQNAADILGLNYKETSIDIVSAESAPPIKEKYVCIGTESTAQAKLWNYNGGWQQVVDYLVDKGYKVVSLVQHHASNLKNVMEPDAPKLSDKIQYIKHCEFFIGLGSGLSWVAWALKKKIVLISGFSEPFCEFNTPYRIINKKVCNGCFNDDKYEFFDKSWYWCPAKKDFECTKQITPEMVIEQVKLLI